MPVRKMSNRNWLLTLAAACFVGIGLFMLKGDGRTQEIAEGKRREEEVREGKNGEDVGAKNLSPKVREGKRGEGKNGEEMVREGKSKEEVAQGLKEIPREELVAYLLEEDSELIENLN